MKWIVRLTLAGMAVIIAAILAGGVWAWVQIIRPAMAGVL